MAQYTLATNVEDVQTIQNPDSVSTGHPARPASGAPAAMAIDYVNVRTGPGTNYPVLGVAPPGASGEVSGKSSDGDWWQVKIPAQYSADGSGWVSADWVVTQNTDSVPVVAAPRLLHPLRRLHRPPLPAQQAVRWFRRSPADGTVFAAGTAFETTWVLQNTGSTKWDENEVRHALCRARQRTSPCTRAQMATTWLHPFSLATHTTSPCR